jgi:ATP:ADP antiporter, AAA family
MAFFERIDDNLLVPNQRQPDRAALLFLFASSLMVAHLVAGKAVRDGLFLSRFPPSDLPMIVAAAAIVAVLLGFGFARLLWRTGPLRLVPIAFGAGSALHLVEYWLLRGHEDLRSVVIAIVYLHIVGFGAILLSGFWSIVNEHFNPREAKLLFGRIAGAGTVGGIAGGLLAERGAALFGVPGLLLLLAALHLVTAALLWLVPRDRLDSRVQPAPEPVWRAARDAFRQAPFLVNLAVLVMLGTMSGMLLDYLFKSNASVAFGKGPALTRYFAIFYTVNQVLTFAVQTLLTPIVLRRLGLGRTVIWHPVAVALGAGASLLGPQAIMAPVARGLELVLRGSFLRSGYELFFTPVPPREKRAVKTFIDVGCDRMGDAFGAGVLQVLLLVGPKQATTPILFVAIGFALVCIWITTRMDVAYIGVLQHGLLSRAVALNKNEVQDSTTSFALQRSVSFHTSTIRKPAGGTAETSPSDTPQTAVHDAVLARLGDLRSGVPRRVASALRPDLPFDPSLLPQAIRLLGRNEVHEWARAFLLPHANRAVGQLVDALLDPEQDFAVRRRIPRILAYSNSQRAVDGLTTALEDSRFEIRYHSCRALEFLHRAGGGLRFNTQAAMAAIERELAIPRPVREERRLLGKGDDSADQSWFLDDVLKGRADKSLEHIFSLLALELPKEPLRVAFRAFHSDDKMLRGLALEYLESNLSGKIVSELAKLAEAAPTATTPRARQEVLNELMASQQSVLLTLRIPSVDG